MQKIDVYDIDAEQLELMADQENQTVAEIMSRIMDFYIEQLDLNKLIERRVNHD